jgi:hypothetical protein
MGIASDAWFSTVTQEWYGSTFTPDQFQQMWQEFLSSPDVKYLPANATEEDYHRLFLQFIAPQIIAADPWFAQITQAAYGSSLTDAEVKQIVESFLALPEVLALRQPASQAEYHTIYLRFISQIILSQDTWYKNATLQFYGETTADQLQQILLEFLSSPAVLALPSTATAEDYQSLYIQFLYSHLKQTYQISVATAVSPDTVAQSKVLWSVFNLLSNMITTMSIAQIRDSEVMLYLTEKRNEYAKMLAAVPLYVGTGTVDTSLNDTLAKQGLEGYAAVTNNLINVDVSHFNSSLNKCEWYWTGKGLIVTGGTLKAHLSTILQGLVNQITTTGDTVAYYDSPSYTDGTNTGGGYHKKIIIKVVKNDDGTFSAYYARRSNDDGDSATATDKAISNWHHIGEFKSTEEPQVVSVSTHPIEASSADSVYTTITPSTDPAKFLLGYAGLTLKDISQSIYTSYNTSTATSTDQKSYEYTLYSGDWLTGAIAQTGVGGKSSTGSTLYQRNRLVVDVSHPIGGQPVVTVSLVQDSATFETTSSDSNPEGIGGSVITTQTNPVKNKDGTIDWDKTTYTSSTLITQSTTLSNDNQTTVIDAVNSSFISVWQQGTNDGDLQLTSSTQLTSYEQTQSTEYQAYAMEARDPKIAWKAGILASAFPEGDSPSDYNANTVYNLDAQTRAKNNQLLQSYLSAISARMDVLSNTTDQQQQVVDTSSSGIQATNNIINAIIEQMMQLLESVFR